MLNYYTMFVLGTTAVFYILLISRFGANSKNLLEDGYFTIIRPPIINTSGYKIWKTFEIVNIIK
jgi:hypothetical protein